MVHTSNDATIHNFQSFENKRSSVLSKQPGKHETNHSPTLLKMQSLASNKKQQNTKVDDQILKIKLKAAQNCTNVATAAVALANPKHAKLGKQRPSVIQGKLKLKNSVPLFTFSKGNKN